jgi:predicted Zn finger-like uncharacterized protein
VFTQCPKCETVFRLSAEALRAAGGQVRCGRCGEVFNALARLAEDATGFAYGESAFELESRADEILQSAEPVPPADTPSDGIDGRSPDEELTSEASLEFTLPPGELDRIFIETTPSVLQVLAVEAQRSERNADPRAALRGSVAAAVPPRPAKPPPPAAPPPNAAELPPASAAPPAASAPPDAPTSPPTPVPSAIPPPPTPPVAAPPDAAAEAHDTDDVPSRVVGFVVAEDVRREMLSSYAHAELPAINTPRRSLPYAAWAAAAVALAGLLAAQLYTSNREWFIEHIPLPGGAAHSAPRLSSYQLRQWGVTGDPGAKGTLKVRATIMNAAAQPQPYPLLRVTLANRFGKRIAQRDFEPSQYLGKPPARMLGAGEHADATLELLDPGKDAEGFEIDVCVGQDAKIACAGDVAGGGAAAPAK